MKIVSRLSELAESKIGRLTFHFAAVKLENLSEDVRGFSAFISRRRFHEKRNYDISHKELPEKWSEHKHLEISYLVLLKAIVRAIRLMKRIDGVVLGPSAKYLWREMRKKRYALIDPARTMYMVLPHLNLSPEIRGRIIMEEMAEGRQVWSEMVTIINGRETKISASREWGAILLQERMIVLDHYPLQQLTSIDVPAMDEPEKEVVLQAVEPITAEKKITARYRVSKIGDNRISFVPVERQHPLGNGVATELVDININLNGLDEKLRAELDGMNAGDEKEFSMTV